MTRLRAGLPWPNRGATKASAAPTQSPVGLTPPCNFADIGEASADCAKTEKARQREPGLEFHLGFLRSCQRRFANLDRPFLGEQACKFGGGVLSGLQLSDPADRDERLPPVAHEFRKLLASSGSCVAQAVWQVAIVSIATFTFWNARSSNF